MNQPLIKTLKSQVMNNQTILSSCPKQTVTNSIRPILIIARYTVEMKSQECGQRLCNPQSIHSQLKGLKVIHGYLVLRNIITTIFLLAPYSYNYIISCSFLYMIHYVLHQYNISCIILMILNYTQYITYKVIIS